MQSAATMNPRYATPSNPRLRFHFRRSLTVVALLLGACLALPAYARQYNSGASGNRAYRKAAKKARKDMLKYQKQQLKAARQSAKAQRKALKRARNQAHY